MQEFGVDGCVAFCSGFRMVEGLKGLWASVSGLPKTETYKMSEGVDTSGGLGFRVPVLRILAVTCSWPSK